MEVMEFFRAFMWIVALTTALASVAIGVMLGYHWQRFSMNKRAATTAVTTYSIVSFVLVLSMIAAAPAF